MCATHLLFQAAITPKVPLDTMNMYQTVGVLASFLIKQSVK